MGESKTTKDHEVIRRWAEARGGKPARVKGTGKDDGGLLRINFPGFSGESTLEEISWDDFFQEFDDKGLTFLYQEQTNDGQESRFFKFIRQ